MLAVSTEDGRLLFYSTSLPVNAGTSNVTSKPDTPVCEAIGQLGGIAEGLASRIKDFEILQSPHSKNRIIVAGSSDGAIRLWKLDGTDLRRKPLKHEESSETEVGSPANGHTTAPLPQTQQVGQLLGTYEAGNRITCLTAFVMIEPGDLEINGLRTSTALNKANRLDVEDEISISS